MNVTRRFSAALINYDNPTSFGSKLRSKRIEPLMEMVEVVFHKKGSVNIIDIGGTESYWNIVPVQFLDKHNVKITIVNLPSGVIPKDHGIFSFIGADGCNLAGFDDDSFDIAHSNSVLEHVGDWDCKIRFSKELSRVAQRYFVQTPNYWFPIEPHYMVPFIQWLPEPFRIWLVMHFSLGYWNQVNTIDEAVRIVENARLLNRKMFKALFKDAQVFTECVFGLPKSFIAIKNH